MHTKTLAARLHDPTQNNLLAALPAAAFTRLLPDLELVALHVGQVLHEAGKPQTHLFFPTTAIVTKLYVMEDGSTAEIAVAGREGVVGISLFMGGISSTNRAIVQTAGHAYALKAAMLQIEFELGGSVQHLLLRYTQAMITQMSQTALCNRHHPIDQQLCRWMLMRLDRLRANELDVTQEDIASLLGVTREGVSMSASSLQRSGLIRYTRGKITVLDRPALEALSCECYVEVKREYDRLLPHVPPPCRDFQEA